MSTNILTCPTFPLSKSTVIEKEERDRKVQEFFEKEGGVPLNAVIPGMYTECGILGTKFNASKITRSQWHELMHRERDAERVLERMRIRNMELMEVTSGLPVNPINSFKDCTSAVRKHLYDPQHIITDLTGKDGPLPQPAGCYITRDGAPGTKAFYDNTEAFFNSDMSSQEECSETKRCLIIK